MLRAISQMFGGGVERRSGGREREGGGRRPAPGASLESAADAARKLERTIAHFESVLGNYEDASGHGPAEPEMDADDLSSLKRALREVVRRLEDAVDQLGSESSRLAHVAGQLEVRLGDLTHAFGGIARPAEGRREPASNEPQFRPDGRSVDVVLAAVPGFQGLMDAQRALTGMPGAERASVVAFKNGEASLELALRSPVSARQIVEELGQVTGYRLLIEEARPEARRLRLRFVEQGARDGPAG